jgi:hypothetical protein
VLDLARAVETTVNDALTAFPTLSFASSCSQFVPLVPRPGTMADTSEQVGVGYERFGKSYPWCYGGVMLGWRVNPSTGQSTSQHCGKRDRRSIKLMTNAIDPIAFPAETKPPSNHPPFYAPHKSLPQASGLQLRR